MSKEKKRTTLEQLKALPLEMWQLEAAQIGVDAALVDLNEIESEAMRLMDDPNQTPEMVVELRERLRSASVSTEQAA